MIKYASNKIIYNMYREKMASTSSQYGVNDDGIPNNILCTFYYYKLVILL